MNALLIDRDGTASRLAAEGKLALGSGETALAAEKYAQAGAAIERSWASARRSDARNLARFLAATQYYLGGHYGRALKLANRIEARLLPPETRPLLTPFMANVRARAAQGYASEMRQAFSRLWLAQDYKRLLNELKDHPYVYDRVGLAFLRGSLCQELERWDAGAAFYAMAISEFPDGSDIVLLSVARVLGLPAEGRIDEAWAYIGRLRELVPNTVTNLVASFVCFFRASRASGADRAELHKEQLRYFDEGLAGYEKLPSERQQDPEMQTITAVCFSAASHAALRLGDDVVTRSVVDRSIRFAPHAPGPLTARGVMSYPSQEAVDDFRKAAALPNPGYAPFLYLAHQAFINGRLGEAEQLCQEALARNPGRPVRAQLLGWLAVIRDCQGAPREQVEGLFSQAFEVFPGHGEVEANYRIFKADVPVTPKAEPRWSIRLKRDDVEEYGFAGRPRWAEAGRKSHIYEVLLAGAT
ncbi:hypothetical protein R5W24_006273 [Gemmata sp. JC717]|uniref:Tetratricopeptide repeat protein n=1 Tax=Gemmata algarum TaxID=2975278 RepID=A0ABU5F374_9BACT|nr:hypothetical protein [Gemmata algarum]MDY3557086.1 hypothetical protein [Gemmata algarum]MDY3561954.1 hypothetical protein [Gemmata algarum]